MLQKVHFSFLIKFGKTSINNNKYHFIQPQWWLWCSNFIVATTATAAASSDIMHATEIFPSPPPTQIFVHATNKRILPQQQGVLSWSGQSKYLTRSNWRCYSSPWHGFDFSTHPYLTSTKIHSQWESFRRGKIRGGNLRLWNSEISFSSIWG